MATSLTLSHMVDLALGTPEIGAVNFNVLHSLLHALVHKLNIADVKADIKDEDREFLTRKKSDQNFDDGKSSERDETDSAITDMTRGTAPGSAGSIPNRYRQLEEKLGKLEQAMETLNDLPSNSELFERAKAKGNSERSRPVADMWQGMQLGKRVDTNEAGIDKLMSLVEDMMREVQALKDRNDALQKELDEAKQAAKEAADAAKNIKPGSDLNEEDLMKRLKELEDITNALNDKFGNLPGPDEFESFVTWPGLEDALKGIRQQLDQPTAERVVIEMSSQTEKDSKTPSRSMSRASTPGPSPELGEILERLGLINDRHDQLDERVTTVEDELKNKADKADLDGLNVPDSLMQSLADLQDQLDALKKGKDKDSDAVSRMQQAILQLQAELERLSNTTQHLIDENDSRVKDIESLTVICNKLDETKADKEFVQTEVDVKADKRHLDGKVNRSLFDTTCDELNKMINDILNKLMGHEDDWKKALGQLSNDLDGKLDRLEFGPIREELERQLKALMKKLNALSFRDDFDDDDAAGLRKQMIQKFNCISCDRPIDMVPQGPVPSIPNPSALPATRSARPYTTFELEQIRQHAKSTKPPTKLPPIFADDGFDNQNIKNYERALVERQLARCRMHDFRAFMVHFGNNLQSLKTSPQIMNQVDILDLYATNRACGGSHTLTYPHKRVTRLAQINNLFREEEIAPPPTTVTLTKEELDIQGADGHIYKGRNEGRLPNLTMGMQQPQQVNATSPINKRKLHTSAGPRPPAQSPQQGAFVQSPRPTSARLSRPTSAARLPPSRPTSAAGGLEHEVPTGRGGGSPPPPPAPSDPDAQEAVLPKSPSPSPVQ